MSSLSLDPVELVASLFVTVLLAYIATRRAKGRTASLREVAQHLSLDFAEAGSLGLPPPGKTAAVGRIENWKDVGNVMSGEHAGFQVRIFDQVYCEDFRPSGRPQLARRTLVLLLDACPGVPDLALAPEGLFSRAGPEYGNQDIDYPQHPEFSDHYVLRGNHPGAVYRALGRRALAYVARERGWHVEVLNTHLIVARGRRLAKPSEVIPWLEGALRIAALLNARD
jgi:hypothetical protein